MVMLVMRSFSWLALPFAARGGDRRAGSGPAGSGQRDVGEGAGKAKAATAERRTVDVEREQFGGVAGTAEGHDIDGVEGAEEVDHAQGNRDHDDRPQQGQRDVQEALPGGGAVDVAASNGEAGSDPGRPAAGAS